MPWTSPAGSLPGAVSTLAGTSRLALGLHPDTTLPGANRPEDIFKKKIETNKHNKKLLLNHSGTCRLRQKMEAGEVYHCCSNSYLPPSILFGSGTSAWVLYPGVPSQGLLRNPSFPPTNTPALTASPARLSL